MSLVALSPGSQGVGAIPTAARARWTGGWQRSWADRQPGSRVGGPECRKPAGPPRGHATRWAVSRAHEPLGPAGAGSEEGRGRQGPGEGWPASIGGKSSPGRRQGPPLPVFGCEAYGADPCGQARLALRRRAPTTHPGRGKTTTSTMSMKRPRSPSPPTGASRRPA